MEKKSRNLRTVNKARLQNVSSGLTQVWTAVVQFLLHHQHVCIYHAGEQTCITACIFFTQHGVSGAQVRVGKVWTIHCAQHSGGGGQLY